MTTCRSYCLLLALLAGLLALPTQAQKFPYGENVIDVPAIGDGLSVSNTFQSNMVLQRDKPIYIWGWAEPGEKVAVRFAGNSASTTAGKDRAWKVELPAHKANATPQAMTIKAKAKAKTLTLDNILVGDVWLLGGQSNMEFELAKVENGNLEIVSANFPEIRILTVPRPIEQNTAKNPGFPRLHQWNPFFKNHDRKGDWDPCTPEVARELSAIGYAFARRVHKASGVPIGVIDASRGGSAIETWVPTDTLHAMDSKPVEAMLTQWDKKAADWDAQADLAKRISSHRAYIAKQRKENKPIPANRREEPSDLRPGPAGDYNHPGHLYAGMIGPIKGLSIKGVVFHQGFNNALNGQVGVELYRDVFPEMIHAWRRAFDDKDMPFCILSLCTEGYPQTLDNYAEKMLNAGIEIRAAHYEAFLDFHKAGDEHIGFVSTFDLRRRWYHPQVKLPAGERAARWALATQYGFANQVQWKPPMLVSMTKQDGSLLLTLDTKVSDPQDGTIVGFAIAGEDRKFHPAEVAYVETGKNAQGKIQYDKAKLILTSPMVSEPVHFRYAWGRNPLGNLQVSGNKDLPFATQRSDDWPMHTVPLGVLPKDVAIPMSRGDQAKLLNALKQQDKARKLAEAQRIIQAIGQE